jgi:hypothetical protein
MHPPLDRPYPTGEEIIQTQSSSPGIISSKVHGRGAMISKSSWPSKEKKEKKRILDERNVGLSE